MTKQRHFKIEQFVKNKILNVSIFIVKTCSLDPSDVLIDSFCRSLCVRFITLRLLFCLCFMYSSRDGA